MIINDVSNEAKLKIASLLNNVDEYRCVGGYREKCHMKPRNHIIRYHNLYFTQ